VWYTMYDKVSYAIRVQGRHWSCRVVSIFLTLAFDFP
jgi:hypothetical protein